MNRKLAELTVRSLSDPCDKVVKALENAGLLVVLDLETTSARYYTVAEKESEE